MNKAVLCIYLDIFVHVHKLGTLECATFKCSYCMWCLFINVIILSLQQRQSSTDERYSAYSWSEGRQG